MTRTASSSILFQSTWSTNDIARAWSPQQSVADESRAAVVRRTQCRASEYELGFMRCKFHNFLGSRSKAIIYCRGLRFRVNVLQNIVGASWSQESPVFEIMWWDCWYFLVRIKAVHQPWRLFEVQVQYGFNEGFIKLKYTSLSSGLSEEQAAFVVCERVDIKSERAFNPKVTSGTFSASWFLDYGSPFSSNNFIFTQPRLGSSSNGVSGDQSADSCT
jgi:hypothetical protein